ncbi:hypothetical protein PF008_g5899 [Phytophthora fragariae]|uniref:Uncharacterized protein n=1 Tax=Phytophthora fragariae TaxID=53985 RepID=A0A6G0S6Z6_9STRA|nr:hypothetical protein PF008_g5899 [Phytophthora fragariae]
MVVHPRDGALPPSSSSSKRKRDDEAFSQRQVAQRLQLCADVGDAFAFVQRSLQHQFMRYAAQKARADELSRLHVALEQCTHFQALSAAEMGDDGMDPQQVMSLLHRTEKMVRKLDSKKRSVATRTETVIKRLPRLMTKATRLISERRQMLKEQQELPMKFQWVPMVLWRLYDDVVGAAKEDKELKPMKTALHHVMKTLKDTNPFFYLQVLYRPPPQHLDGQWEILASDNLTAIARSMTPFFRELKRRSFALKNKRDSFVRIHHGWEQLRFTLTFTRRAARHFHFLILHLYALAMGCDESNVHAGIISEKATSGMLRDDAELRSRLRLSRESAYSEDHLIKETYEWTPELLVYLDEWRRHQDSEKVASLGFDRRERHCDFLPQFPIGGKPFRDGRRIPRTDVLGEIGFHLRNVRHVWRASRLGTRHFESMRIEDIGRLERKIKHSLAAVVDLVYKMMLARWMDRRKRPTAWWNTLELRKEIGNEENSEDALTEIVPESSTIEANYDGDDGQDATDAESVEHKECQRTRMHLPPPGGFRSPRSVNLSDVVADSSRKTETSGDGLRRMVPRRPVLDHIIQLGDIYAWTYDDLDSFHHDVTRIDEVRTKIIALSDRLDCSKVSLELVTQSDLVPPFGDSIRNDWSVSCIANHVCSLTTKAAALAEEAAMHNATITITKSPDMTTSGDTDDNNSICSEASNDAAVKELQESVEKAHLSVKELLAPYDGTLTPEWRDLIKFTGRGTIQLLRSIAREELLCKADQGSQANEA